MEKALHQSEEIEYKKGIADAYNNLGYLSLEKGDYKKAVEDFENGLSIAKKIGTKEYISNAYEGLFKAFKKKNDYENALINYELYIGYRDSLVNEETQKATIRQQTKYEFEKEQLVAEQIKNEELRIENEKIERRNNLQYSIILVIVVVLLSLLFALGKIRVSTQVAEGLIFFAFLILFEFLLVLADPYIDNWTGGAPGWKLLLNAGIAAGIFPLHAFFEKTLKQKLIH